MIINGSELLLCAPIENMETCKIESQGVSYGLGEAGYDIRIAQTIIFKPAHYGNEQDPYCFTGSAAAKWLDKDMEQLGIVNKGKFILASAIEKFNMPDHLCGVVHDKSTWARHGLSVFNTVIKPGWKGYLTLELVYHGEEVLVIPAGSGIAQVLFHEVLEPRQYTGKYANQSDKPVPAILRSK